jgi:prepilin-type N-terminal cleavage/methylation domain-containing protein
MAMDDREKRIRIWKPASDGPRGLPGAIIRHQSSFIHQKGFTLIELLVVIAIIALLMAILLPALQRVRKQAKAVACKSNLREWSLILSMYTNEHDGRFFLPGRFLGGVSANGAWPYQLGVYRPDSNDLLLCPAAGRHEVRTDVTGAFPSLRESLGSASTAWEIHTRRPELTFLGSYGFNSGISSFYEDEFRGNRDSSSNAKRPYMLDCIFLNADPKEMDEPPEQRDAVSPFLDMSYFCLDRHSARINGMFLDLSVRWIGIKELWTLNWNFISGRDGPWTKAGGAKPEDWPEWMRGFKDY